MKKLASALAVAACLTFAATAWGQSSKAPHEHTPIKHAPIKAQQSVTHGSVTIEGHKIDYKAIAGTIIMRNQKGQPTGSMFYVAYVKPGANKNKRPVTFFYNGGPGSSTIWLHMGAFGPKRIATADHTHTPAAPYQLVNNDYSLLDVTDEVFIDAMGTGYSRILGKDEGGVGTPKDFWGVDPDIRAFAQFIKRYLGQNDRWNSPKYLYGESYGTVRSEILANYLSQREDIDVNGVVLQSSYTGGGGFGGPTSFATNLPTFAAVAWYHHKLPNQPAALQPFLAGVEQFAMGPYLVALNAGNSISDATFNAIAEKLHEYTGLSVAYIKAKNLRVSNGEFRHQLLHDKGLTVGQLDGRFTGPTMDMQGQRAEYDPQAAGISPAYLAGFIRYAHHTLHYGEGQTYRPEAYGIIHPWPRSHENILTGQRQFGMNAGVDLAQAMKYNPNLRVEVDEGYYDLDLPYYGMLNSIHHLKLPKNLLSHIAVKYYESGHMIYAHIPGLKKLHDNTAAFIQSTANH